MSAPSIRLALLPDALDADGQPRPALIVTPAAERVNRRAMLRIVPTVAAALAAKREMEAGR